METYTSEEVDKILEEMSQGREDMINRVVEHYGTQELYITVLGNDLHDHAMSEMRSKTTEDLIRMVFELQE